jgi:hypothetical protein
MTPFDMDCADAPFQAAELSPNDSQAEGQTMNDDDRDQETPDTGHEQRTGAASPEPTPAPFGSFPWGTKPWATPEESAQ